MAHCCITVIGTEEQYIKARSYLLQKENPGYYNDIENGMDEMHAYYKWGDLYDIGGSDWVKLLDENFTKQEFIDKHLVKYIKWYNDYGDRKDASNYLLDVREADTNIENIDMKGYLLSKFIEYIKALPEDVNIMIADSHW